MKYRAAGPPKLMIPQKVHLSRLKRDCASPSSLRPTCEGGSQTAPTLYLLRPCPACGGRAFYETIGLLTFYESIKAVSVEYVQI
jgi:hypothetical protein